MTLKEYFNNDELASNVWESKYKDEGEITPDDMHKRLASKFALKDQEYLKSDIINSCSKELSDHGYSLLKTGLTEEYVYNLLKDFKYIIPQGSVMSQLGTKSIGSLSNCFVVGQPEDSYGGIFLKEQEMIQLMKRRGGVGIDISKLRPKGAPTTNAAKSSTGAISFMPRFSNGTREVSQEGRRGALMLSIDINHPDVMDFIKIKRDLSQVTGANISIKINDDFMKAVENDEDYLLKFPCNVDVEQHSTNKYLIKDYCTNYNELYKIGDSTYTKKIKAKEYWDEIIKSAHNVAEPGLMFWDSMVNYSPDGVYPQFKQVTTNPCSEIAMQEYDACRLIAVNLFSFVDNPFTNTAKFNIDRFKSVNYSAMRMSDVLVDLELDNINLIIDKIKKDPEEDVIKSVELELWEKIKKTAGDSRRTGLGFTALGDVLAALNLKYDSEEALKVIEEIMHAKMESELNCTIDLAILRGRFKGWNPLLETNDFYNFIDKEFPEQASRMDTYGRRNVSWSTVAPTGTVSLMTQTTSGLEPLFMPYYMRRKKVNVNDKGARVDFTDQNGDTWQEFAVLHPKFKDWLTVYTEKTGQTWYEEKECLERFFKLSPWYNSTANDIDWIKRVEIQSTIQKYITHSISSTINLPEDVSEEEVSKIYLESWKQGLKGITVYRDGSRSGVLVNSDTKPRDEFDYIDATKRPKEVICKVHTTITASHKYNIFIGLLNGKPYEVFVTDHFTNEEELILRKIKKGRYDLIKNNEIYSEDITTEMSDEQEAITRLVSTSLRHGADIKFIVEQLSKTSGDMFGFTKALGRVLKKYIPDGAKSTVKCNDCGSSNVIFQEGCNSCLDCGSSACS